MIRYIVGALAVVTLTACTANEGSKSYTPPKIGTEFVYDYGEDGQYEGVYKVVATGPDYVIYKTTFNMGKDYHFKTIFSGVLIESCDGSGDMPTRSMRKKIFDKWPPKAETSFDFPVRTASGSGLNVKSIFVEGKSDYQRDSVNDPVVWYSETDNAGSGWMTSYAISSKYSIPLAFDFLKVSDYEGRGTDSDGQYVTTIRDTDTEWEERQPGYKVSTSDDLSRLRKKCEALLAEEILN